MTHLDLLQVYLEHSGQLLHVCVLINTYKDLVEEGLKVVSLDTVHHKALQEVWLHHIYGFITGEHTCSGGTTIVSWSAMGIIR